MITLKRLIHTSRPVRSLGFKLDPNYKLKCGLEIHTQLKTKYKLFSLSSSKFDSEPNTNVSYFDCGLPGTLPKLNPEALYLALKTAVALNSDVQSFSTFDRKHYFYPDQPQGFQITQRYHPIAKNGYLELNSKFDDIAEDLKTINIEQIQIEQDTGKTNYDKYDKLIKIDLNRSNVPLIELVTKPDFENMSQIRAFIKKYQTLVKHLDVCTGDLETGAIRIDLNVSINGGNRVEVKNLGSSSELASALKSEYHRQIHLTKENFPIIQETRGWNGKETVRLRSKENAVEYRYVPDSELPFINLDPEISREIAAALPDLPDTIITKLISEPYNLELKHAKFFIANKDILNYYYDLFQIVVNDAGRDYKVANNWLVHELIGAFSKFEVPLDISLIPPTKLGEIIIMVSNDELTTTSAKQLLSQLVKSPDDKDLTIQELIEKYDLGKIKDITEDELSEAVEEVCVDIIANNQDVIEKIVTGKSKSINYLIGLAMKETNGKVNSKVFETKFKELISNYK